MENKGSSVNSFLVFVEKHRKALGVGIISVMLLILVGIGLLMSPKEKKPEIGVTQEFVDQSENKELLKLLKAYYKAYAKGKVKNVKKYAYPISDREKSYIKMISEYIKSYEVGKLYSKEGADPEALMLSVEVGIRYEDLKTVAPGLDFFYMEKDENGKYYINNLYSTFNTQNGDLDVDPSITSLIASYERQKDVVELQEGVSQSFNEIILKNKNFNVFFTSTLPDAVADWAKDYKKAAEKEAKKEKKKEAAKTAKADKKASKEKEEKEDSKDNKDKEDREESKSKTEEKATKEASKSKKSDKSSDESEEKTKKESNEKTEEKSVAKSEKKSKDKEKTEEKKEKENSKKKANKTNKESKEETVYATDDVNVRAKPSTSAKIVAHVDSGTKLIRYTKKNGWSKIRYNGSKVWIKSGYLTTKAPNESNSSGSAKKGKKFKMSTAVNIRAKRNANSRIVAAVHDGEYIEIIKNFDDGWSKVRCEGKVGFMKTELIK